MSKVETTYYASRGAEIVALKKDCRAMAIRLDELSSDWDWDTPTSALREIVDRHLPPDGAPERDGAPE